MASCEDLRTGFDYDLWANIRWLHHLVGKASNDEELAILGHILSAQKVWTERCKGNSPDHMMVVPVTEHSFRELRQEWDQLIERFADNPVHSYTTMTGDAFQCQFFDIALHVINHGTYHRGELRGIYRARNESGFPETDRIRFTLNWI